MSRTQKEKLEKRTDIPLQLISENETDESVFIITDDFMETSLEQRKKDADKPLYLKRI